jgi:hypothetical protein
MGALLLLPILRGGWPPWKALVTLLVWELDMVIVPGDRPVMLVDERQWAHLPEEEFVAGAVGTDVQRVINPASLGEAAES